MGCRRLPELPSLEREWPVKSSDSNPPECGLANSADAESIQQTLTFDKPTPAAATAGIGMEE